MYSARFVSKLDLKIANGYFSCLVGVSSLLDWFQMTRARPRPVLILYIFQFRGKRASFFSASLTEVISAGVECSIVVVTFFLDTTTTSKPNLARVCNIEINYELAIVVFCLFTWLFYYILAVCC